MIVGAAFCPHPPALVPQLAQGAAAELAPVRAAAVEAVRRVAQPGVRVLVVGAGASTQRFGPGTAGSLADFGADVRVSLGDDVDEATPYTRLPLSLAIGAWLLAEALGRDVAAHGWSVAAIGANPQLRADVAALVADADRTEAALVVMGDGSARRSPTAPGYYDERAEGFDAGVAHAMASGEPAALGRIDAALGADLLAAGVPAWHAAAAMLRAPRYRASMLLDSAPYGVGYFVATWLPLPGPGASRA